MKANKPSPKREGDGQLTPLVKGNAKAFDAGVTEPAGETEGHEVARGFYRKNHPVFF